ncbi:MAG TPA: hypothetical protein VGR32_02170 [Brevundimonas sp.]|jgi:type II secretory pathway component PulM|uniref:hypothetical protein n=1 Tax=Brevundimonas sp. TaxID=1871086 RepID=UPI002DF5385E|nr:hypothetical protein [Brevundimonas sp.]
MFDRLLVRRWRDDPRLFWALLILGAAGVAALLFLRALPPGDAREREARTVLLESQAVAAQAAQAEEATAEKARRADLMN